MQRSWTCLKGTALSARLTHGDSQSQAHLGVDVINRVVSWVCRGLHVFIGQLKRCEAVYPNAVCLYDLLYKIRCR